LPLGDGEAGDKNTGASPSTSRPTSTASDVPVAPAAEQSKEATTTNMLTPANIRTAIKAIEKETGRKRFGDFTVYRDYAIANVMVKGSDTAYDSYTYRPGKGVEKSIIDGTLMGGDQPFSLDGFNWDRVPALFAEADKKLNVKDPELRYVLVKQPNDLFDTPLGMAVYLTDKYNRVGYLEADTHGKVTKVSPAEN
jgi:hypothetical protein